MDRAMRAQTIFNALTRQLLIHIDEKDDHIIIDAFNTEAKIRILRALAFNNKTSQQIIDSTGISEPTFYRTINQLIDIGLVESKGKTRPKKSKGGPNGNLWGLV